MAIFVQIGFILIFLMGCSAQSVTPQSKDQQNASKEIEAFKEKSKKRSAPELKLPSVYQEITVFDEKKVTFASQNAKLDSVLYSMAEIAGLNLIMDKDVDTSATVTVSLKDAPLKDALDTIMKISGCFYDLRGNILHVKQFEQKSFRVPYVHSVSSFKTELGGDMLSSSKSSSSSSGGSSGGGSSGQSSTKGEFSLKYDNPVDANNFYDQLEKNIAATISKNGKYTLNRFSGILSVYDKRETINAVEEMINKVKKEASKQVQIEAKILEVVLNDAHSLGVSWDVVAHSVLQSGDQLNMGQTLGLSGAVAGTMSYSSRNFSSVITALKESGDVDTLSNPSINVLSGQSAMISSGKLVPFWEKQVQTTSSTSTSGTEVTYNRRDVLDGVTMGVTPTIMEDGRIMLNIVPVTSKIEEVVNYTDQAGNPVASAPIINIKEAGTVIQAKDNDLVLIGGLINKSTQKQKDSVPLLGDIPYLGGLFTKSVDTHEKRELVILLRLKVVE